MEVKTISDVGLYFGERLDISNWVKPLETVQEMMPADEFYRDLDELEATDWSLRWYAALRHVFRIEDASSLHNIPAALIWMATYIALDTQGKTPPETLEKLASKVRGQVLSNRQLPVPGGTMQESVKSLSVSPNLTSGEEWDPEDFRRKFGEFDNFALKNRIRIELTQAFVPENGYHGEISFVDKNDERKIALETYGRTMEEVFTNMVAQIGGQEFEVRDWRNKITKVTMPKITSQ